MPSRIRGQRRLAARLTILVILLQGAVIGAFLIDPGQPPRRGDLWQALWALKHRESFIPLIALILFAPPASWLSWTLPGRHRWVLAGAWITFGVIASAWFAHRILVMIRLTYEHGV